MTSFSIIFAQNNCLLLTWRHFLLYIYFNVIEKPNSHKALFTHNHVLPFLFLVCIHIWWYFCYCLIRRVKQFSRVDIAVSVIVCVIWNTCHHTVIDKIWIYFIHRILYFMSKHKINLNRTATVIAWYPSHTALSESTVVI